MHQLGDQNIISLSSNPIPPTDIPRYPGFKHKLAKGGELTYYLDEKSKFADGKKAIVHERFADTGDKLRDIDLRFLTDSTENEIFRGHVKAMAANNDNYREMQLKFCQSSILYFANVYCYTKIPGLPPIPFITFPFQDDILTWVLWLVKHRETGIIEKSREMGMSWILQIVIAYLILFNKDIDTFQLSITEAEVDNRTDHSLFGKLRYLLRYCPIWMRKGWDEGKRGDLKMLITIPDTKSTTEGVLTGGQAGRGGRSILAFYDEFAHIDTATEAVEASASASKSKVYLSTVKGRDNMFAQMAHDPRSYKKTLHWTLHPLKNKEWAIKERARPEYNEEVWAQEHDIKYEKSSKGRVYPMFSSSHSVEDPGTKWMHVQRGDYFEYDPHYNVLVGIDLGLDSNSIIYAQEKPCLPHWSTPDGKMLVIFAEAQFRNQLAVDMCRELDYTGYNFEEIVVDFRTGNKFNQIIKKTIIDVMSEKGYNAVGKYNSADAPIEMVRFKLGVNGFLAINGDKCPQCIRAFENWSFPVDKNTGFAIPGSKPKHDGNSHIMKATAYLFDWRYEIKEPKRYHVGDWEYETIPKAIAI